MTFSPYSGTLVWEKSVPTFVFPGSDPDYFRYTISFSNSGFKLESETGYVLDIATLNLGVVTSSTFLYDSTSEIVRYRKSFGPQQYYVHLDFYKTHPMADDNKIKLEITGSIPSNRTLSLNLNPLSKIYDLNRVQHDKHLFYGNITGDEQVESGLVFDWGDASQSITAVGNRVDIPVNSGLFTVDPTTGVTLNVNGAYSVCYPCFRHSFYDRGMYWLFYANGAAIVWRTQADTGTVWSSPSTYKTTTGGAQEFEVYLDKSNHIVHTIHGREGYNNNLTARVGTLRTDGTIDWRSTEYTIRAAISTVVLSNCHITVDSNGYEWVSYREVSSIAGATIDLPVFHKNSVTTGTNWINDTGSPFTLDTTDRGYHVGVYPLRNGTVFLCSTSDADYCRYSLWDPTSKTFGVSGSSSFRLSNFTTWAGSYREFYPDHNGDVHAFYMRRNNAPYRFHYSKFSIASQTFGTTIQINSETLPIQPTWMGVIVDKITEDFYFLNWDPPTAMTIWSTRIRMDHSGSIYIDSSIQLDSDTLRYQQAYSAKVSPYFEEGRGMYYWLHGTATPFTLYYNTINCSIPFMYIMPQMNRMP